MTASGAPRPLESAADVLRPDNRPRVQKLFGSKAFFRLWLAQVISALGDWIGLVAVTALAARIGGSSKEAAVGLVLSARLIPGFFFGSVAGVLVDRLDRKKVMVACDIGRGAVYALLPFVHTIPLLFLASLLLEALTLLWQPAKEASVPNLVEHDFLPTANSLSLAAAYGTFPIGAALFTALAGLAGVLGQVDSLGALKVSQENLAIWADTVSFLCSAGLIATLTLPARPSREADQHRVDLMASLRELRDGWKFIGQNRVVRTVILALGTGLVGGGMVVPLGPVFSKQVLGGGTQGFGALITALGTGVAIGVVALTVTQKHFDHQKVFAWAVLLAGSCLIGAASMWSLTPALLIVGGLGLCAGAVYVLGFSLVQQHTEDELRGRTFATLYTLVRLCVLLAFAVGPFLSSVLDKITYDLFAEQRVYVGGWHVTLTGVRLSLWIAGVIVLGSGVMAQRTLSAAPAAAE